MQRMEGESETVVSLEGEMKDPQNRRTDHPGRDAQ